MNKSTKEELANLILSQHPEASIEFTVYKAGSQKDAKALARNISDLIKGNPELIEKGGLSWYRIIKPGASVSLFFERSDEDRKEQLQKRLEEIKRESEMVQQQLDTYMIEDVKFEEEEEAY